ncbi:MAG TPA: carbamoyl phosphate synthase large subunit, partial [Eggerthellaceae bacterium]|nr:carbamoyl phosphate synthase large subunit [Eggerthellaceae bacterium]
KVCGIQMVQIATDVITMPLTGRPSPVPELKDVEYHHYGVKEAVFPFNMFPEVDPVLGPEMRSTGEVLGLAGTFGEAFYKSQEATQTKLPLGGTVLLSVSDRDKDELVPLGRALVDAGFEIIATRGTRDALVQAGIPATLTLKASEGRPNVIDLITNGDADLVINTPSTTTKSADDGSAMRRAAIKAHVAYMTTIAAGKASAEGIKTVRKIGSKKVRSLQEVHANIKR